MYGPAQKQPLRAWIPNRSLSTATTKFECSSPRGWRRLSDTIASRSSSGLPRISMFGLLPQDASARRANAALAPADLLGADRLLEREHEPGADRLDDRRRARLLADRPGPGGRSGRSGSRTRSSRRPGPTARGCAGASAWRRGPRACRGRRRTCAARGTPRPWRPCRSAGTGPRRRSRSRRARRAGGARSASRSTSETIPVTFDAAEKLPTLSAPRRGAAELAPRAGRCRSARRRPRGS